MATVEDIAWKCNICKKYVMEFYVLEIEKCKWEKISDEWLLRRLGARNALIVCENCAEEFGLKEFLDKFCRKTTNKR